MICIAAFIILAVAVLAVPIIRLFNRKLAAGIMQAFKRSVYCFTRHVTLRACDSTFKDDIKGALLRKVVLKHPDWVKPLSGLIEAGSVLIIVVTIWSLLVGTRSLVALYVYGTCDIEQPSACSLAKAEACSIDSKPISMWQHPLKWTGKWFGDFGEAIAAIPDRMKHWNPQEYVLQPTPYYNKFDSKKPLALDIFDPGCIVCKKSFQRQLTTGFFDKYNVTLLPYAIEGEHGTKFANSGTVVKYMLATVQQPLNSGRPVIWQMAQRMYTKKDKDGIDYQTAFNFGYSTEQAEQTLQSWLKEFGYNNEQVQQIVKFVHSDAANKAVERIAQTIKTKIKTKKIPTMIFDGQRHDGEYKQ